MKLVLSFGLLVLSTLSVQAQDTLIKKNGQREEVKIREIGSQNIVYKRYNNSSGPDYVVPKSEVARIRYENGTEDVFAQSQMQSRPADMQSGVRYGLNIVTLTPIAMTNTSPSGIGIAYERVLDKEYNFSFYLPATISFRGADDENNSSYNRRGSALVCWFYPGLKIYPSGSNKKTSYAIGASLPIAVGRETEAQTFWLPNGNPQYQYRDNNIFLLGAMLTNYLNVQASPKVYLGIQLGFGIPYFKSVAFEGDEYRYFTPGRDAPWTEFSFRVGYRY